MSNTPRPTPHQVARARDIARARTAYRALTGSHLVDRDEPCRRTDYILWHLSTIISRQTRENAMSPAHWTPASARGSYYGRRRERRSDPTLPPRG